MANFVVPGNILTNEQGYLRGHGSYLEVEGDSSGESRNVLYASVAGQIERINKLVSVKPQKLKYVGEVGDLVVGRISAVEGKRWKVDINATKDAVLQLSSVNLVGGEQRMRTNEDQMSMRSLFVEGDLISAEIQNIGADGTISIHTRSLRYGKLENGTLFRGSSSLIKRLPQHYVSLMWGVDIILGRNGNVWITRSLPDEWKISINMDLLAPTAEDLESLRIRHSQTPLLAEERLCVARVYNLLNIFAKAKIVACPDSISSAYQHSLDQGYAPKDLLHPSNSQLIVELMK